MKGRRDGGEERSRSRDGKQYVTENKVQKKGEKNEKGK